MPATEHREGDRDRAGTVPEAASAGTGRAASVAPAGWVALVILAGLPAVWAWQYGGWFGNALYPGTVVLALCLILLALFAPLRARLRGWPAVAVAALVALGIWATLSAFWSPSPDVAVEDGQRILTYAIAFVLGLWLCDLLRARMHLAMAPLAFAGLFAGVLTVGAMLGADEVGRYLDEGTLQYPIGYRNANAAFFLIALWPAVGLAATRELDWRLRALSLGAATLCLELAALSQSRGSIIAAAAALLVYLAASRDRARALGWLVLAVLPALIIVPALADLYQAATELSRERTIEELHTAGRTAAIGAALAIALAACAALLERRFPASPATLARANRGVAIAVAGLAVAGLAGFVIATGDPVGWVEDRWEEFRTQGTPQSTGESTRLGFNAGSERDDFWRVALDDAEADPVLGTGAGGFYYSYLRGRSEEGAESARDAHSVELEFLGELGIIGFALFGITMAASAGGALRARRLGSSAAALSTCALTAGVYWLVHSSIDWFWSFPALTAGMLALLGSACAPAILGARAARLRSWRWPVTTAAALLALTVVPPYLSERYVDKAFDGWSADVDQAYEDLDRAADLNPLDEDPLLTEGGIARAAGDRERAIDAFERAADKRPEEWAAHYFLAILYSNKDPGRARQELDIAAAQNPLSVRLDPVRQRIASGN
jgi:tetratricopeptide (TPR) repeat protein